MAHVHLSSFIPTYKLVISELILSTNIVSSSNPLSWPQGTEFVDLYLKFLFFYNLSIFLSHNNWEFYLNLLEIFL